MCGCKRWSNDINESNNNNGRNGSFFVASYIIEDRRRLPVITASPRGQCSKQMQNFEGKACSDEKTLPVAWSDEKLILLHCPGQGLNSRPPAHHSFKHGQGIPHP